MDPFTEQLFAAAATYQPSRREYLQLARMQASIGLDLIEAGNIAAAKTYIADALGFLDKAREAK